jgi:hypothetical protein
VTYCTIIWVQMGAQAIVRGVVWPFAVIKRVLRSGHVLMTTVRRVHVKMVFCCFCFNLVQLGSLVVGWAA